MGPFLLYFWFIDVSNQEKGGKLHHVHVFPSLFVGILSSTPNISSNPSHLISLLLNVYFDFDINFAKDAMNCNNSINTFIVKLAVTIHVSLSHHLLHLVIC